MDELLTNQQMWQMMLPVLVEGIRLAKYWLLLHYVGLFIALAIAFWRR